MDELRIFAETTTKRLMAGLYQELEIVPNKHYAPKVYNSSRVVSLRLSSINPGYLDKIQAMDNRLTMWAGIDEKYPVRIGHDGASIVIEVPKPKSFWSIVSLEEMEQRHYFKHGAIATIGMGLQDEPIRLDFRQEDMAHVLIAGMTRSGKTNCQKLCAWNLANNTSPDVAKMIVFDVAKRGYKWSEFSNVANLAHPVITDLEMSDRVLAWSNLEIEKRATEGYTSPKLFFMIDELKALISDSKVASDYISRIASIGGEFGLHLIMATQYPQIGMLGNAEIKRNVSVRLCGKVDDAQSASNTLGIPDSGAQSLQGYGDFLLKQGPDLSRLTVAHLRSSHVAKLDRIETVPELDLPDVDVVNNGAPRNIPDCLDAEHVAVALFEPQSVNKLSKRLGIGNTKATRLKTYADKIRQWAYDHGHGYCFLTESWIEDLPSCHPIPTK